VPRLTTACFANKATRANDLQPDAFLLEANLWKGYATGKQRQHLLASSYFPRYSICTVFVNNLPPGPIPRLLLLYPHVMHKFFLVSALLLGVVVLAWFGNAFFRYLVPEAPASPVLLFASYDSGVNGTLLKFRLDSTFQYENLGFYGSTDVVIGRYTRIDSIIRLDRLPKTGMLKRTTLLVRPSPFTETGQGIWQVGPTDHVDSTLAVFTIFPLAPVK
jgi:hypothetical protein